MFSYHPTYLTHYTHKISIVPGSLQPHLFNEPNNPAPIRNVPDRHHSPSVHYFSDFPAVAPFLQELYRRSSLGERFPAWCCYPDCCRWLEEKRGGADWLPLVGLILVRFLQISRDNDNAMKDDDYRALHRALHHLFQHPGRLHIHWMR